MAGGSEQKKWLIRVHPSLKWKLDGPNVRNPFDANASVSKLEEYVMDRSALMSVCTAKAFMDETEILRITDLTDLKYETVHPNIINLERSALLEYLEQHGVWELISKEINKFQQQCQDELRARQS